MSTHQSNPTHVRNNRSANQQLMHDLVTFGVILCLVIGGLAGLYYYDQSTNQIGDLSKQLFDRLVN